MVKTGFSNAFINTPGKKAYKYHGLDKDCNIQINPTPNFEELTTPPIVNFWELLYDFWPPNAEDYGITYDWYRFLPSVILDTCYGSPYRYYYSRSDIYQLPHLWKRMYFKWTDAYTCSVHNSGYVGASYHFETNVPALWGQLYIMEFHMIKPPSHIQIWRSSTGELPGYIP